MVFVAVAQTAWTHARNEIAIYSSCGNLEKLPVRPTRGVHDRKPKNRLPAMFYQANAYDTSGSASREAAPIRMTLPRPPAGDDGPDGTVAAVRSPLALRCFKNATALHILIHQRHPMPSCGGLSLPRREPPDPALMFAESLSAGPELENSQGSKPRLLPRHNIDDRSPQSADTSAVVHAGRYAATCRRRGSSPTGSRARWARGAMRRIPTTSAAASTCRPSSNPSSLRW